MIFTDAGGGAAAHDEDVRTRDGRRDLARPGRCTSKLRKEGQMPTPRLVRAYARYLAGTLATIAFRVAAN